MDTLCSLSTSHCWPDTSIVSPATAQKRKSSHGDGAVSLPCKHFRGKSVRDDYSVRKGYLLLSNVSERGQLAELSQGQELSQEQLAIKEIAGSKHFNSQIITVLEKYEIVYRFESGSILADARGGKESKRWPTFFLINEESGINGELPDDCFMYFKKLENNTVSPVVFQSDRLNRNIVDNMIAPALPVASLAVSEHSNQYTCMHVAMNQIALTSLSKGVKNQPRFLTTTGVGDCHAVVFWDKATQTAVMTHFQQGHMCKESFDFMLEKILQYASIKDLSVLIVGGRLCRMRDQGNFFDFIEKYLEDNKLSLKQTFLGLKYRSENLLFDCQEGQFYDLEFSSKGQYSFWVTDDRKDLLFSFKVSGFKKAIRYYYSAENKNHFIPVNISFS